MPQLHELTHGQRERLLERVLKLFLLFCRKEFRVLLYPYQIRIVRALLSSIIVEPKDVYVKVSRQSGKTEAFTLLLKFLMVYYRAYLKRHLMAAVASPKGEQAKTDVDRVKRSIPDMAKRWHLDDRENNAHTVRAYRFGKLSCELFLFSLAPTTSNESKTLNVLAIEESHKADHKKRRDELDPMLASTGGVTWHFGVGCPVRSDYKTGCDGQMANSVAIVVPVDEVILDRRALFEQTGDPIHLAYEKKFLSELNKYGRQNPEIRRNYYLEDTVEEGNFISRERLVSCARIGLEKAGKRVPVDRLYVGIDWARRSDFTWVTVANYQNDVIDWLKVPHVTYPEQVTMIREWLKQERNGWRYMDRVLGVRGDATGGSGDAPNEILQQESGLPMSEESFFVFTKQGKNDLYVNFEGTLFKDDAADPMRFSYPADHPLTAEFEDQMAQLLREYTGDGEYLAVHHPKDDPGAKDDAPDSTALALLAAANAPNLDIQII
jgi:hypothetical protein